MSQITKNAIIEKTLELAEKKPINKITVKELTQACGITRNTFYYHFHDVYDVVDSLLKDKVASIDLGDTDTLEERLFDLLDYAASYKKVWVSIYNAMGREKFSEYMVRRLHTLLTAYFNHLTQNEPMDAKDKYIVSSFYEEAVMGILIRWLLSSKSTDEAGDLLYVMGRIRVLFSGQIELVIENSREHPPEEQSQ